MTGDCHVRFCERVKLKCLALLGQRCSTTYQLPVTKNLHTNNMYKPELLFVYNAGSGLFDSLTDFAHKIIAPSTYQCHLCALTYGNFAMKQQWKEFIESLQVGVTFLHKDVFQRVYHSAAALPAVFSCTEKSIDLFLSREQINQCRTLNELQALLLSELSKHDQHHHTNLQ